LTTSLAGRGSSIAHDASTPKPATATASLLAIDFKPHTCTSLLPERLCKNRGDVKRIL
jgi:hypothetical protein